VKKDKEGETMINVAVLGATGYAGAELVRILAGHPQVHLTLLTSRQYADIRFDAVYPSMTGIVDLVCQPFAAETRLDGIDVVFLALPHKLPMGIAPDLLRQGKRIIDLSADFRLKNAAVYEAHYQAHSAKDLLPQAVYGLCEVYTEAIRKAELIGNPGCYPTSVLLPLVPLLKAKLIETDGLIADSKSGVSGAGRSASLTTHYCQVSESFKAYKVGSHRHTPEMEEILSQQAGEPILLTFVPHLVPMSRGMQTTLYATLKSGVDEHQVGHCLQSFYRGRPFVRICTEGRIPETMHVRGTNFCDIGFKIDARNRRLILLSVIDNLVKGAAGQAVQNMNLMLGIDETTGLMQVPYPL
jgi:N-acetyl-gamma-glutamyl-phosphate reductase